MQRPIDAQYLKRVISESTGLRFEIDGGVDSEGQRWYLLWPSGIEADYSFSIRTILGWRRLHVRFEPGKFAASLLSDMGNADVVGRSAFRAVLSDCDRLGSRVSVEVNGLQVPFDSEALWTQSWHRVVLAIDKGQIELGTDEGEADTNIVCRWTGRLAAAVAAVLPTEEVVEPSVRGYREGAVTTVRFSRYERDRRNRAAAIAIHGTACQGCGLQMGERYGPVAAGFIEVHHVTPVSQIGEGYMIDPGRDLVPLCPNCHAVVHRHDPPLTLGGLSQLFVQD